MIAQAHEEWALVPTPESAVDLRSAQSRANAKLRQTNIERAARRDEVRPASSRKLIHLHHPNLGPVRQTGALPP